MANYGQDIVYDSHGVLMAERFGNDEGHTVVIDSNVMELRRDWQNWLNETDILANVGVVFITSGSFSTQAGLVLVQEDVFGQL